MSPTSRLLSTSTHSNEALGSQVPGSDAVADANKDETILVTNATGTCVSPPPSTLLSEEQASKQTQNQGGPDPAYQPPEGALETIKHWIRGYASLSKFKLSSLVLATTMFGYYMAPVPIVLTPFVASSVGTALTIFSACSINQIMEISNDAKMLRTKSRWLPSQRISTPHAIGFSAVTGISGFMLLYHVVNPLAAILATGNLVLYTAIYTPMKQTRPVNTWVGAIVGAVPPMIGWASATGGLEAGSWVLGSFLGAWQMPHFMALSYALKDDYQRGGFKMLINVSPDKVPGVTLRYSVAMMLLGPFSFLTGITSQWFVFDSLIPTSYLLYLAIRFYKNPSPTDARKIFRYTLLLLPVLMGLMIFHQTDSSNLLEAATESDDAKSTTETKDEKL